MTTSRSDFASLQPGWLVGYRETPDQPWLQAEVIANDLQCLTIQVKCPSQLPHLVTTDSSYTLQGQHIVLVDVTLDLNDPAHLEQLGTPF